MKTTFTFRPFRFLWTAGWTIVAVLTFGWWVLLPVLALQFDVVVRRKR